MLSSIACSQQSRIDRRATGFPFCWGEWHVLALAATNPKAASVPALRPGWQALPRRGEGAGYFRSPRPVSHWRRTRLLRAQARSALQASRPGAAWQPPPPVSAQPRVQLLPTPERPVAALPLRPEPRCSSVAACFQINYFRPGPPPAPAFRPWQALSEAAETVGEAAPSLAAVE